MAILYEDRYIVCDDDAITIHMYYFPLGSKRIRYSKIRKVKEYKMGILTGKFRIWGTSFPTYWFHLDLLRPTKDKAIIIDTGDWVQAVITPEDHETVMKILRECLKGRKVPAGDKY